MGDGHHNEAEVVKMGSSSEVVRVVQDFIDLAYRNFVGGDVSKFVH